MLTLHNPIATVALFAAAEWRSARQPGDSAATTSGLLQPLFKHVQNCKLPRSLLWDPQGARRRGVQGNLPYLKHLTGAQLRTTNNPVTKLQYRPAPADLHFSHLLGIV